MQFNSLTCRTIALIGIWFGATAAATAAKAPSLQTRLMQIGFDARTGQLVELVDTKSNWNHVADRSSLGGLWSLEMQGNGRRFTLTPDAAKNFRFEQCRGDEALRLIWSDFAVKEAPDLSVVAEVQLPKKSASSYWKLGLEKNRGLEVERVHFPRLLGIRPQADEFLAAPVWMGELAANPRNLLTNSTGKGVRLEWESPGHTSMQCLAFYRKDGPGLYLSCDDTAGFRKSFAMWGGDGGEVCYEMVHLPDEAGTETWRLPYHAVIGVFQGDWFTAAERYRSWATNQPWALQSRLVSGKTPAWARETGMWIWNRGHSTNVLEPAIALEKELGLPVQVFWHWWHGCAYDTGFPEYFPPREGTDSFKKALARAQQENIHAIVYMNQRLWGMSTESWTREGAQRYAVKGLDGSVRPEVYNTFTKLPCASMCIGTEFWRSKYASLAERAIEDLGVDGIYMDQACSSIACYDPTHGHAPGGGRYWMEGFKSLAQDIRSRCSGSKPIVLAGEGCGENWLPFLDLMLSLQVSRERYSRPNDGWQPIPFFQAVYHPYCLQYGNYSSLTMPPYDELWPREFAPAQPMKLLERKYSQQFLLEQARAFVWGQQPTVANFLPAHLRERAKETQFVMQLARLRGRSAKYLRDGTFLRPPVLQIPQAKLAMSRLSIYAGQQGALQSFEGDYPLVWSGAWRAPDGDVAVALASIADFPVSVPLTLNALQYGLPRKGKIYRITASNRILSGTFDRESSTVEVPLAARDACLIEFSK